MQIVKFIKRNRVVLIVHTLVALYALLGTVLYTGEGSGSGWQLIFIIDFPISILFAIPYELLNEGLVNTVKKMAGK